MTEVEENKYRDIESPSGDIRRSIVNSLPVVPYSDSRAIFVRSEAYRFAYTCLWVTVFIHGQNFASYRGRLDKTQKTSLSKERLLLGAIFLKDPL